MWLQGLLTWLITIWIKACKHFRLKLTAVEGNKDCFRSGPHGNTERLWSLIKYAVDVPRVVDVWLRYREYICITEFFQQRGIGTLPNTDILQRIVLHAQYRQ